MNKEIYSYILEINDKELLVNIRNSFMVINALLLKGKTMDANNRYNQIVCILKDYFGNNDLNDRRKITNNNVKMKKLGVHPAMGNKYCC
ncbi:MAG: hypothetical protein PUB18_05260 [bacterium]|nr:hypothetical protein [bacterium]